MKKIISAFLAIVMSISMSACGNEKEKSGGLEKISLVLDWTPNTNHTGLYVAQEKGYFEEQGLEVEIVQPPEGGADSLVASGKSQFGISFQDTIAPAFASDSPLPVTGIAAILQHNTSGIISLKGNGVDTPSGMSEKTYATWDVPVEKAIIKSVVESDGGNYDSIEMVPSTVTDVVTALKSDIDAVWVYYAWDGIASKVKGVETDFFAFKDIDPVLDYYSPIIIGNNSYIENNEAETKSFLEAVSRGYEYAAENPEEAAEILLKASPELDRELVMESQKWIAKEYKSDAEKWGVIDKNRWDGFYKWLWEEKLVEKEISPGFGFTNEYLPE
jgi:ABC-type nitrate/sulfonate/bicarbonate transport system substrate-binding protein